MKKLAFLFLVVLMVGCATVQQDTSLPDMQGDWRCIAVTQDGRHWVQANFIWHIEGKVITDGKGNRLTITRFVTNSEGEYILSVKEAATTISVRFIDRDRMILIASRDGRPFLTLVFKRVALGGNEEGGST